MTAAPESLPPAGLPVVVLVHYGAPGLTRRCLESLVAREPLPHRVLVVDHGPAGLGDALEGAHPDVRILPNLANPGFGPGCNLGAELAFAEGAEAVWFLNNDATLEGPTLGRLLDLARAFPEVALWGTLQRDGDRLLGADHQDAWFDGGSASALDLPEGCRQLGARESLSGASILVTRSAWARLGPWPGDCFLYLEDTAWCGRAHRLGLPMVMADLAVTHPRSSTTGRRSPLCVFYGVRNLLRLHRDYHPGAGRARFGLVLHLLQKRFFQGRWGLLLPTLRAARAARRPSGGRDPRY